jgi:hypothetical protein
MTYHIWSSLSCIHLLDCQRDLSKGRGQTTERKEVAFRALHIQSSSSIPALDSSRHGFDQSAWPVVDSVILVCSHCVCRSLDDRHITFHYSKRGSGVSWNLGFINMVTCAEIEPRIQKAGTEGHHKPRLPIQVRAGTDNRKHRSGPLRKVMAGLSRNSGNAGYAAGPLQTNHSPGE